MYRSLLKLALPFAFVALATAAQAADEGLITSPASIR
jgi:hypothetical protein